MSDRHKLGIALVVAAALALFAWAAKRAPGGSIKYPAFQGAPQFPPFTPPPGAPVHGVDQAGPYGLVYTPHRYPAACGNDISVLIHRGYATMALPAEGDMTWLSAPPSEGEL